MVAETRGIRQNPSQWISNCRIFSVYISLQGSDAVIK